MEHKTKEHYIRIKQSITIWIGNTWLRAYIDNWLWYLTEWGCPYIWKDEQEAIEFIKTNWVRYNAYSY